ncbi:MAG: hypothetical protein JKY08_07755, partial [Flavobacteriaceae bacterium]|nr:hypothetical protein [Flavobacteriaceae bacterium]
MSSKIYPIIFFSISSEGKKMMDAIKEYSSKINQNVYSNFVNYAHFDGENSISTSINEESLVLSFNKKKQDKQDSYSHVNKNRQNYLSVFESLINSVKNIDNINYASENNFEIGQTQIIILSSIYEQELSPLVLPLLLGIDSFKYNVNFQLLLFYNQELTSNKSNHLKILKTSFLREMETLGLAIKPTVWLFDIINEKGINLKKKENLYHVLTQFVDLRMIGADTIEKITYNNGNIEKDRPCMYASVGYSILRFPVEKAHEYLKLVTYSNEFIRLKEKFDLKFESILLKDELTKFLKKNNFEELPAKLSKDCNSESIYKSLNFNQNQIEIEIEENVLSRKLNVIDNYLTLSKNVSSDFFQKFDKIEKDYINNVVIEFSGELNKARNREFSIFTKLIDNAQNKFIDNSEQGINYAILFVAILSNNKSVVEDMLDGRFTNDIPTLISLEDKFRGVFIGDEVSIIEKELRVQSDNSINKKELLEKYSAKLRESELDFDKIVKTVSADNPKLAELKASIQNYNKENSKLSKEIDSHNKTITSLKTKIEKIKSDFDRDATKEGYNVKRNVDILTEINEIRSEKIIELDNELSKKYEQKNISVKERKKFIFKKMILIPSVLLISLLILQLGFFYNFESFNWIYLKNCIFITILIELIYLTYASFNF